MADRSGDVAGRTAAFEDLAGHHLDDAYRLASAILGDPVEAEDAVHDAFIAAWRKWPTLRDRSKFEAWFHRILVNTCRDRLRRASRSVDRAFGHGAHAVAPDPFASAHVHDELDEALAKLSADDQVILVLRFYLDLSMADAAGLLGVRSVTARVRLHRALGRLRNALVETGTNEVLR